MEQPEPALLQNLVPTPLSLQEAAAIEQDATVIKQDITNIKQDITITKQDTTAIKQDINATKAPTESPLPVSAVDWQRIETFREKL